MTIESINIEKSIASIQKKIKDDQSLSPSIVESINLLILIVQLLVSRLTLNSRNSSLPPSSNNPRKIRGKDKKKRKKRSLKAPGGQEGHEGSTLQQVEDPDEMIALSIDRRTLPANESFSTAEDEVRQVIDINLEFIIREYRAEVLIGKNGGRYVADFPKHITKAIQYGPSVKSLAVYMSQYQLIPYNRVQEVFKDQFGLDISQGTLCNFNREAYDKLESFEQNIIEELKKSSVLNADETGIKINGELSWLHVLGDKKSTYYFPSGKRGKEAMDMMGVIPNFKGILCHDHWKPYLGYDCRHALCNAHHGRELQWVIDFKGHKWAKSMKRFLYNLSKKVDEAGGVLDEENQKNRIRRYREIIKQGQLECPIYVPSTRTKNKGKVKQTKERNLLDRLKDYENEVLLFMKDKEVPFTNNQAERDIRMVKVHQKISGQFKSMKGAKYFCRIRGYLMTLRKRGYAPLDKLMAIFDSEYISTD